MRNAQGMMDKRLEVKYMVDRTRRTALARDLRALMRPDVHAGPDGTYAVRSLYFDTPDYMAYHSKLAGQAVRHKLRARVYSNDPEFTEAVRIEVKSRYLSSVRKLAAFVSRDEYLQMEHAFRRGTLPARDLLDKHQGIREFFRLQKQYNMEPKIMLQYRREAYERTDLARARVNFDDELVATRRLELLGPMRGSRRLLQYTHCIFEIKVDGVMPFWMHKLIQKYDLTDRAISKFCHAIRSEARMSSIVSPGEPTRSDVRARSDAA